MDVAPTIFSALNMRPISTMKGVSLFDPDIPLNQRPILLETYRGAVLFKRKSQKYHLKIKPIRYAVVQENFKLILNKKKKSYEAYDLNADFFEIKSVFTNSGFNWNSLKQWLKENVQTATKFIQLNLRHRTQKNSLSQKDFDMLKSLGYID
jgi:hypothetical protein